MRHYVDIALAALLDNIVVVVVLYTCNGSYKAVVRSCCYLMLLGLFFGKALRNRE